MHRLPQPPVRLLPLLLLLASADPSSATVIVDRVDDVAARAGLEVGDRVEGWQGVGNERSGRLEHWWQLELLTYTELGIGPVELLTIRGNIPETITLPWQELRISAQPVEQAGPLASPRCATDDGDPSPEAIAANLREGGASDDLVLWNLVRCADEHVESREIEEAVDWYERASELAPAPFSGELDRRLGDVLRSLRRYEEAATVLARGLETWASSPGGELGASTLLAAQGDLRGALLDSTQALKLLNEACAYRRRFAPASWFLANCLNNLGIAYGRRNDLANAEKNFLEALALDSTGGRTRLSANLGIVARLRGDLERAESYILQSLEGYRASGRLDLVARQHDNLANIVADNGDLERAIDLYTQAIADYEALAQQDGAGLRNVYFNRASAHVLAEDLEAAEADLMLFHQLSTPGDARTSIATSAIGLQGEIALQRGDLEAAIDLLGRALHTWEAKVPDSSRVARTASILGRAYWQADSPEDADAAFRHSIQAIERQQGRAGGGDRGLVAFRTKFTPLYQTYVEFLLAQGREDEAFELSERARAQALRALLRGRDLDLARDEPSFEVELRRKKLGREIESTYRQLARLAPEMDGAPLRLELQQLHAERDALTARLHANMPRAAAAEAPPAFSLDRIRAGLPEDTLLLEYALGRERSTVFAVDRDRGLTVHPVAAGQDQLRDLVVTWADLVSSPRPGRALDLAARRLSDALLSPVVDRIKESERLLIVPDGVLFRVAFGALPDPADPGRYLIERAALATGVSASVDLEGREIPLDASLSRVAVFGDPSTSTQAVARFRRELGRLPASRVEAAAVQRVFGDRAVTYLDDDALEATARRELGRAAITHFACHAVVDERLPLDSALVLTEHEDQGLLQAWEIAEQVQVASDLVVLSACETARTTESSEGILGLVRSLQIAGAESVVASLWRVQDDSTAALMERFYHHLADGAGRADALRSAQLALLAEPISVERNGGEVLLDASSPRHWAPFVLIGRMD